MRTWPCRDMRRMLLLCHPCHSASIRAIQMQRKFLILIYMSTATELGWCKTRSCIPVREIKLTSRPMEIFTCIKLTIRRSLLALEFKVYSIACNLIFPRNIINLYLTMDLKMDFFFSLLHDMKKTCIKYSFIFIYFMYLLISRCSYF